MIKRALLSVSDKEGLVPLAKLLHEKGVALISTGGTAQKLKDEGLPVTLVSDVTEFPEIMNGRVKTLHPSVHGGLLAVRDNEEHMKSAKDLGIEMIDLVVVNLYPFEKTVTKDDVTLEEAIENIDIGGPSMLRSAAKNYRNVCVLTDPADYATFENEFVAGQGSVSDEFRAQCARKVFALTAKYDGAISTFLQTRDDKKLPETLHLTFNRLQELRYGENPHQHASLYTRFGNSTSGIASGKLLNGKELSFNNIVDIEAAWNLVQEFSSPACAVIKHTNPCGCAVSKDIETAFEKAWEGDPVSAFGSIIAFNRCLDTKTANAIVSGKRFVEAICAPEFESGAVEILAGRKGWGEALRLMQIPEGGRSDLQLRTIGGGLLVQNADTEDFSNLNSVGRQASDAETTDMKFAWLVCKHLKSNAISIVKDGQLIGAGAGQMNRVKSVDIAIEQAGDKVKGAVLASDAFFPFPDSIERAAEAGIAAIIQPGGSKKDPDVIEAAIKNNMAMILTGMRHFRHG